MTRWERVKCFFGFHVGPPKDTPRERIWYVEQRDNCGYGRLWHKCVRCERWFRVPDSAEITPPRKIDNSDLNKLRDQARARGAE